MYRAYNLQIGLGDWSDWQVNPLVVELQEKVRGMLSHKLDHYVRQDSSLDGSAMQEDWFPQLKPFHVFISHSHQDYDLALRLASKLFDTFQLLAFIDSDVWGYSDDLLRSIDDRFCYNSERDTYSYSLRNKTTSHVHMMLMTAISQMMYNTECLFFLNTPNSIVAARDIPSSTFSPWIYSELALAHVMEKRSPEKHRRSEIVKEAYVANDSELKIRYKVSIQSLNDLRLCHMILWEDRYLEKKSQCSLDDLYSMSESVYE
jgi:hypothetical protein